ncbi:hypothetical protein GCM10010517_43160 [Streptosporangium fragile]|uniref:Secreted protein n=1 Tax=Streptosporangium fragile TaxID=46186 RepID=A0ABN3W0T0_9ACTN
MEMSKQTTFALTLLVSFSVVVPGSAGYLSAKMEAIEHAHRELLALENRLRQERLVAQAEEAERTRRTQPVSAPARAPCEISRKSREVPGKTGGKAPGPTTLAPAELDPVEQREARRREQQRREAAIAERASRKERRWVEREHESAGPRREEITATQDLQDEIIVPEPGSVGSDQMPLRSAEPDLPEHPQTEVPAN